MRFAIFFLLLFPNFALAAMPEAEFDADQYGRINLFNRQTTRNFEAVLNRQPNFEQLQQYGVSDRLRQLSRPIGRLDIVLKNKKMKTCTASIISDRYILTNNHCISGNENISSSSIVMNYYNAENEKDTKRYEVDITPVETNVDLDYSILAVRGNPSNVFGVARIAARDPAAGESLLILHHPGGLPKYVTRGGCLASNPNPLSGNEILHRCDTLPGSSGAPVLAESDGRMIGLHFAGMNEALERVNFAKRMSSIIAASPVLRSIVYSETTTSGQISLGDGKMYKGELRAGIPEGSGILTDASGAQYEGKFISGQLNGEVKITYADGVVYPRANFSGGVLTGLSFCNKTSRPAHLSFGYNVDGKWISEGWWRIDARSCYLAFPKINYRYYYWRATSQTTTWQGDKYRFCTHDTDAFKYDNSDPCNAKANLRGYHEIDLNGSAFHVHNFIE